MGRRLTGRNEVLIRKIISSGRLAVLRTYVGGIGSEIFQIDYHRKNERMELKDLRKKISNKNAAVYVENPTYLRFIGDQVERIAEIAHKNGIIFIVGVDG